jgi:hypothetical protein
VLMFLRLESDLIKRGQEKVCKIFMATFRFMKVLCEHLPKLSFIFAPQWFLKVFCYLSRSLGFRGVLGSFLVSLNEIG